MVRRHRFRGMGLFFFFLLVMYMRGFRVNGNRSAYCACKMAGFRSSFAASFFLAFVGWRGVLIERENSPQQLNNQIPFGMARSLYSQRRQMTFNFFLI